MNPRPILRPLAAALGTLVLLAAPAPAQQQDTAGQDAAISPPLGDDKAFSNLPEEKRKEFVQLMNDASKLFAEKRIFETLDAVAEAAKIFPDSAALENIRGSCYVEFRDFDRARQTFERALELAPDSPTILFNIAEVDFCAKHWQPAHDGFTALLPKLKGADSAMTHLVEFKVLLCKLMLGQVDEARAMVDKHGFMDDTPYHFFAQSAMAFHQDDKVAAEEWLGRAVRIYRNPQILAPWQDTLIEFGYIKSFYGGDLDQQG